ncbi:MAG: carboxypeptidase-like regulatory domain-containing protein [Verrucomicrobiota bacterium]
MKFLVPICLIFLVACQRVPPNYFKVEGEVLDIRGGVVSQALVRVHAKTSQLSVSHTARTDNRGKYSLLIPREATQGYPERGVILTISAENFSPAWEILEIPDEGFVVQKNIKLTPGRKWRVHVSNPQGDPLPGIEVVACFWHGGRFLNKVFQTNGEGRIEWNNAPSNDFLCSVTEASGTKINYVWVDSEAMESLVTLFPDVIIRGQIVDDSTGKSLVGGAYRFGPVFFGHERNWDELPEVLAEHGTFSQKIPAIIREPSYEEGAIDGGWRFRASAPGYRSQEWEWIPGEYQPEVFVEFRLKRLD